jgi:hypothetical protein
LQKKNFRQGALKVTDVCLADESFSDKDFRVDYALEGGWMLISDAPCQRIS